MADPATGTVAASVAVAATAGGLLGLGALMPAGASAYEFAFGCFFAMLGAFAFQFISAQVRRQIAEDKNIPVDQRPKIDITLLGYSMCGAPLSCAFLIFGIHYLKGTTGFGDANFFQSAAGFMTAGAAGPKIVIKGVAAIVTLVSSRIAAGGDKSP